MSIALSNSARKVLHVLTGAAKPLSAYEILSKLTRQGLRSPPTVYRALDQLGRRGLVHRLETMNAFIACRNPKGCGDNDDHIVSFVICTSCNAVQELDDPGLVKAMKKLGSGFFAHVDKKVIELSGVCRVCGSRKKGG